MPETPADVDPWDELEFNEDAKKRMLQEQIDNEIRKAEDLIDSHERLVQHHKDKLRKEQLALQKK